MSKFAQTVAYTFNWNPNPPLETQHCFGELMWLSCALQPFQGFGDTGFHMSFGIGAFPFGFFTTVFNTNDPFHRAGTFAKHKLGVSAKLLTATVHSPSDVT